MNTKKQLHHVEDIAKDFYQSAKEWLPENYTNPWVIGTGAATVGLIGYFLGRSSRRHPKPEPKPFDPDKLMKVAKLWLFYRAIR